MLHLTSTYEGNFNFEYGSDCMYSVCEFIKEYHCEPCEVNTVSKRELKLIMDKHFICQKLFCFFLSISQFHAWIFIGFAEHYYDFCCCWNCSYFSWLRNGNLLLISLFPSGKIIISIKPIICLYSHLFLPCTYVAIIKLWVHNWVLKWNRFDVDTFHFIFFWHSADECLIILLLSN